MRSKRTRPRTTVLSRFSILSKRIADAFNGAAGWKHGHKYQAHPLACNTFSPGLLIPLVN